MKTAQRIIACILILCASLAMNSCASSISKKVSIEGYDNLRILGLSGVKMDIEFRNQSRHNIDIKAVVIKLREGEKKIATMELKDPLEIPKRTDFVSVPSLWRLHDINPMAALVVSKMIATGEPTSALRVDIQAEVKASGISRVLNYDDISLSRLLQTIDLESKR